MKRIDLRLVSPSRTKRLAIQLPETWEELTFKQLRSLSTAENELQILAALSQTPAELWASAKAQGLFEQIEPMLTRFAEPFDWQTLSRPRTLNILEKSIAPPTDLEQETFGQRRGRRGARR